MSIINNNHNTGKQEPQCRIAEIVQHSCEVAQDNHGNNIVQCFPVLRFFKLCKDRPAVEITKYVELDSKDGGIVIPPGFRSESIQGKLWRDVARYNVHKGGDTQFPGSHSTPA